MIAIKLFFSCICVLVSLSYYGLKFKTFVTNENVIKIEIEEVFYGIIFFYITSVLLNFFTPIYYEVSLLIIIFGVFMFILQIKKIKINIQILISLIILFTLILIYIYKPLLYDSNLYHFQGIEWIKNNKIVFGLTNINYRLGQVALNWNISPLLNIFESEKNFDLFNLITFFLLFYIIYKSFEKKKKNLSDYYIIFFFFLIFFQQLKYSDLWSIFNSISSPETDISSGIFLILGIYFFLKNLENNVEINLSLLTSLLLFVAIAIKVTAYPAILVQLLFFYFLFNKNKKIFLSVFSIIFFLYFIFIIKNFVNSGCLIFPISFTCLEPFWGIEVDSLNNKYSLKKFLITVNNFSENTFSYNHVVLRYSTILLIIFFLLYLANFKKNNKSFVNLNKFLKIIIIIFLFSLVIFFNLVKNIRFGWYVFYILFSLLFLIIANNNRLFLNKYLKPYMFILCILFLFSQSLFLLISEANFSNKNYDASYNIKHSSNFSYKLGSNEGFCFDFIPPCSNYEINKNTHLRENFYKFYYLKN